MGRQGLTWDVVPYDDGDDDDDDGDGDDKYRIWDEVRQAS